MRPTVAQTVPPDFRLFGFFGDENRQDVFLRVFVQTYKRKFDEEESLSCHKTTRSRTVHVRKKNITPRFALHVTTGGEF